MPPRSKAQARLMRAAAHGDIELEGMSKEEAREYVEGHKTKHLPERVEKFVAEKRKLKKNVGANRISSGMEDYIIEWIKDHPFLEDREFDRFLASSGFTPEQGKEALYRYINKLDKSLVKSIDAFINKRVTELSPNVQRYIRRFEEMKRQSELAKLPKPLPDSFSIIKPFVPPKVVKKKKHRTFINPETGVSDYRYMPWNEQGERILPNYQVAHDAIKEARKKGFDAKIVKLPDGSFKAIRTKNEPEMSPEEMTDYMAHVGDINSLPEDIYSQSSSLSPNAQIRFYNRGGKVGAKLGQDAAMGRKPRKYVFPENSRTLGATATDPGIRFMKKSLPKKITKFVQEQKAKSSLPTNSGVFGVQGHNTGVIP